MVPLGATGDGPFDFALERAPVFAWRLGIKVPILPPVVTVL
jgi:hypothetical protein